MFEKKKLVINCELCDARRIVEEDYAKYENIMINTEIMLVDDRAKSVLMRLPVTINAEETIALPDGMEVELRTINGTTQLGPDAAFAENTLLIVNGSLSLLPGAQKALENCYRIIVNGSVCMPRSMAGNLGRMNINGATELYPDGAVVLDKWFEMDRFFPLRATQNAVYFAADRILITDRTVDIAKLTAKNVSFVTKQLVILEELVEEAAPLFDISTDFVVVPARFALVKDSAELNEALVRKMGKKLFVLGDLNIPAGSAAVIGTLEELIVRGEVTVTKGDLEALDRLKAQYDSLKIVRSKFIGNAPSVTVDENLLSSSCDGVSVGNAALVRIDEALSPEIILEKLDIRNAALVQCTPEQRGAISAVTKNVAHISDGAEEDENSFGGIIGGVLGGAKMLMDTKIVNAENHVL